MSANPWERERERERILSQTIKVIGNIWKMYLSTSKPAFINRRAYSHVSYWRSVLNVQLRT